MPNTNQKKENYVTSATFNAFEQKFQTFERKFETFEKKFQTFEQ